MRILTPENVYIEFDIASSGSRFAAFIIDFLLQSLIIVLIMIPFLSMSIFDNSDLNYYYLAVVIILKLIIDVLYFPIFEMLTNGQTPGKKLIGLRVLRETGESVDLIDSFLRNLVKLLVFVPIINIIDFGLMTYNKKHKRIGDYIGNTIVVKVKSYKTINYLTSKIENKKMEYKYILNNEEYNILKEFIDRKDKIGDSKIEISNLLGRYFYNKFKIPFKGNNEEYLEHIYYESNIS